MSRVRVLAGTRKGAFVLTSDGKRQNWDVSGPHFAGWEMYHLKGSLANPNRIYASQCSGWFGQIIQRSDDGGKTWTQPGTPPGEQTTPQGPPKAESNKFVYDTSAETGRPLTSFMTALSIRGSSNEFGTLNHRLAIRTRSMLEWKTPLCSARRTAVSRGRNSLDCAATARAPSGNRARGECVCTRLFWIPAIPNGCSSPFRRQVRSEATTPARRGSLSTAVCTRNTFRIQTRRLGTAFIASPCTSPAQVCCSCRSTGTSCAATMPAICGKRSAG